MKLFQLQDYPVLPTFATMIDTTRLTLTCLNEDDKHFIFELLNSPSWLKYIGDRGIKNLEDAKNYIVNGPMKSYEANGFGLFKVSLKADKTPIGICGLIKRDTLDDVDIGFAFLPEYEGKGYAYEAAKATLDWGFKELNLQKVVAITVENNERSIKLLEKLGLSFEKKIHLQNDPEALLLYTISSK